MAMNMMANGQMPPGMGGMPGMAPGGMPQQRPPQPPPQQPPQKPSDSDLNPVIKDDYNRATKLKEEANKSFKAKEYDEAV